MAKNTALIDVQEANRLILKHLPTFSAERLPLLQAAGRTLRGPVHADRPIPPFNRSTMDGFALFADAASRALEIVHTQHAGDPATTLTNPDSTCHRIMTGAVVPDGANTVVPVEEAEVREGDLHIQDPSLATPGRYIHAEGSDAPAGSVLLEPGVQLSAPQLALAAAAGHVDVEVASAPRVALVSTGDELVELGQLILPQQIRPSSAYGLSAMLHSLGCIVTRHHLADTEQASIEGLENALATSDIVITTGGVSKGTKDHLPNAFASLGVTSIFHGVRQRPGKPLWFGTRGEQVVFALPGNPVSSMVCFRRYVVPAIRQAMGGTPRVLTAELVRAVDFKPALTRFCPVRLRSTADARLLADPIEINTSGDLVSIAASDGFIELPADTTHFHSGGCHPFFDWLPALS